MFKNFRIRTKIYAGIGVVVFALLAVSLFAYARATVVHNAAVLTKNESIVFAQVAQSMKMDVVMVQGWLTDISATRAAEGYDDGYAEAEAHAQSFYKGMGKFREMFTEEGDSAGLKMLDDLEKRFAEYYEVGKQMAAAYIEGGPDAGNVMMEEFDGVASAMGQAIDPFLHSQLEEMDDSMVHIESASQQLQSGILTATAFALVLGVIIGYVNVRSVIKPINAMVGMLKDLAEGEGDLTKRLDDSSTNEFGQMAKWFNTFVSKIHDIIVEVAGNAREVASASTEIAASSEQMAAGMGEQINQVTNISSAVEVMSTSIVEVAKKSSDAADNASQSGQIASEGGEVVKKTVDGIQAIAESSEATAEAIKTLGQQSEQIGQLVDVINDIADQTNLLALNAAIEAARAGEAGRGFAVVADEVRKLADRTTTATSEVAQSVEAIQEGTRQASEHMTAGGQRVEEGVEYASRAGESLATIVNNVQGVADMIQTIAAAAEQQSATSEEVSRNTETISSVIKETTHSAQESASAAAILSSQAEQLQTLVGQFKIDRKKAAG